MRRVFSQEKPDLGARVSVGGMGWDEMWNARDLEEEDGDQGGEMGSRVNATSVMGSSRTEVVMVWYHS